MVKAVLSNGDILFGLSSENIKRLQAKQPIVINLKDMGLEDKKVIILFGETEDKIYEELIDMIDLKKTKIHDQNDKK